MILIELTVMINGELRNLFVEEEVAAKAIKDQDFLQNIVKENMRMEDRGHCNENYNTNIQQTGELPKAFLWPDKAVTLLIEIMREKEEEFNSNTKRHNIIWQEIAKTMELKDNSYNVTAAQCNSKWSGLKRSYKNIRDQNNKSGNHRTSWAFYSAMDSMMGEKASIKPVAEASSEGPAAPIASTSKGCISQSVVSTSKGKKRTDLLLKNFVAKIEHEREDIKRQKLEQKKEKEKERKEGRAEMAKMHKDKMNMQKSLIDMLGKFLHNK